MTDAESNSAHGHLALGFSLAGAVGFPLGFLVLPDSRFAHSLAVVGLLSVVAGAVLATRVRDRSTSVDSAGRRAADRALVVSGIAGVAILLYFLLVLVLLATTGWE